MIRYTRFKCQSFHERSIFIFLNVTKTTPVFLPVDEEVSWLLLPGGTLQPENTCSCKLKVTDQVCESQKFLENYQFWM